MMLLLLSLGYTITCGRLPTWATALISVFMTAFAVGYVALFAVEAATFDPALVLYRWESQPGYGLIALMLAAWLFYIAGCGYSFVRHRRKRSFYAPMAAFFSLWLLSTPIAVAINITRVPDYMREKVVNFVELGILFAAQLFYLVITRPTVSNTNFPFHIKTSQIGVITFEEAAIRSSDDADDSTYDRRQNAVSSGYKYPTGGGVGGGGSGPTPYDLPDGTAFSDFSIFTVLAEPLSFRHQQQQQQQQLPPPPRPPPPAIRQQSAGTSSSHSGVGSPSCQSKLLSQQPNQSGVVGGSAAAATYP
uniref:GpcrRhopsn4 domain-containing protein n=1 Tax=Macrostomum lignano TaxID=282301 RepID=A0A1I8HCY2_9PLAT